MIIPERGFFINLSYSNQKVVNWMKTTLATQSKKLPEIFIKFSSH